MTKFVASPRAWKDFGGDHPLAGPASVDVLEEDPPLPLLLDASGRPIVRRREPMGFAIPRRAG